MGGRPPKYPFGVASLELDVDDTSLKVDSRGGDFVSLGSRSFDAIRYLVTRLTSAEPLPTIVAVSAPTHGEGSTFVSRAIAAVLAHDYLADTCWIDLNWWATDPMTSRSDERGASVADALIGDCVVSDLPTESSLRGLSVVQAGNLPRGSRSKAAHSELLSDIINELAARFDHVILDLPPVLTTSDAFALGQLANCYALVVRQGCSSAAQVTEAMQSMEPLICVGSILNGVRVTRRRRRGSDRR